jgi:type IV pilus assembly protein PilO
VANPVTTALNKLPWYGQIGIFLVLSAALAGAFYYYYETPAQAAMAIRQVELDQIRKRISDGQAAARRLPEFRKEISELETRLEVLRPILPTDRDAGDLLRRVQTLAVQSNLTILGFRPQPITLNEMHADWPISLTLEGNYHNLGLFLDKVSKFPRIINVGGINLTAKAPPNAAASMNMALTATTFVLIEDAPVPAAATAKGPAKK